MSTSAQAKSSEPEYAKSKEERSSYPWYLSNIDKYFIPETTQLLEKYSHVPRDQQSKHVHDIRDEAWALRSYPCTGLGVWLLPMIFRSPVYREIITRLQQGGLLVDIGCFVGHDIRRLVFDGAPSENIFGIDIVSHWDIGYRLFQDRDRFKGHFIEADILSTTQNQDLKPLLGRIDVISIQAVLHQWDWDTQIEAGRQLVALSKPGSLFVGHLIGNQQAGETQIPGAKAKRWTHDPASLSRLWDQIGIDTGTVLQSKVTATDWTGIGWDPKDMAWMGPGATVIEFVVTREK